MNRIPGLKVVPLYNKIQNFTASFYRQFNLFVLGLDSIDARAWMNKMAHTLLRIDEKGVVDEDSIIPIIDGGTEGFKGSVQVIVPSKTHCFECMKGRCVLNV